MRILGIIPARYASSRFPGKPLVMIQGKSMIQRVYEQALKCNELAKVIIATDNEVIQKHVLSFNGNVMMTSVDHTSGTERCGEVIEISNKIFEELFDAVINIQGDEPFIDPEQIAKVATCFSNPEVEIATLIGKISNSFELNDPNVVKVVFDKQLKAIYFSRFPIPYFRGKEKEQWLQSRNFYKHIGIYGYRTDILKKIIQLPPSPLEKAESLEQLRWLENGYTIRLRETDIETIAIDVPADLLKITNRS